MKEKSHDKLFVAGLLFSFLIILIYIFANTKYNAQSDWATAVLLAREQMRTGEWFPDSWVYAQSIWTFSLNLLVIPFLYITNNMLLARELAVVVQTMLGIVLCYIAMKRMIKKNAALLVCISLLIPLSTIVNRNFFYEATYFTRVIWMTLLIIVGDNVRKHWGESRNATLSWSLAWLLICVAMSLTDAKVLVMTVAPLLAALILYLGIENKLVLTDMVKHYKVVVLGVLMLAGCAAGLLINYHLKTSLLFDNGVAALAFSDSSQWGSNLIAIFGAFAELYGLDGTGAVVSVSGSVSILKGAIAIILVIGIPVWSICNYTKMRNAYQRIFVLYSVFAAFFIVYICMISEDIGETGRYFLGVYINNMILAGICFDCVIKESKYYQRLVLTGVMAISVLCALQYRDYSEINYKEYQEMIDFLKAQGVEYGFSSYWNAGVTTVLSNGEVELVACENGRSGTPYYWLCSTEWYEPDYHEGDFCFVIKSGEYVDERYREEADEVYQVGGFEILIFRESGETVAKMFFAFPQKTGDSYTFYGDNYYFRTQCGIVEEGELISQGSGAFLYGQYCVLAPGTYRVELDMEVAGTSGCSVEMACASTVFSSTWCGNGNGYVIDEIVVPERSVGSELRIMLGTGAEAKLKAITITKVE